MDNYIDGATSHTREQLETYHKQFTCSISNALEDIRDAEEKLQKAKSQFDNAVYVHKLMKAEMGIVEAQLNRLDIVAQSPSKRKFVAGITTIVLTHRNFIHFFFSKRATRQ
jgi:hypothetical protein